MPFDGPFNKNGKNSQDDIKKTPEEGANRPLNTLLREDVMVINGKQIVISTEAYVKKGDNRMVRQMQINYEMAADGRWLKVDEFIGFSWTGHAIPNDRIGNCCNPWGHHENRRVYLNIDGFVTENGNVLCGECMERYEKQLKLEKWTLGLLYKAKRL